MNVDFLWAKPFKITKKKKKIVRQCVFMNCVKIRLCLRLIIAQSFNSPKIYIIV